MKQILTRHAGRIFPEVAVLDSLDDFMEVDVDGMVIATPGALHAEQAMYALERGMTVFCQKEVLGAKVGRALA